MAEWFERVGAWYLVAQGIGGIAAAFGIFSFQQKRRGGILLFQIVNNVFWTVHMFMLGAWAGGALNAIGIFRGIVFYFREDKKWARSKAWYAVFCAAFAFASLVSWMQGDGALALLPLTGMVFTTFSLAETNPFRVRVISFFSSPCWLTYNIIKGSIPGACTEIFLIVSIFIGILRHDLPQLKNKRKLKVETASRGEE